jgi:hypothetical protein
MNEPLPSASPARPWLEIHDDEITSEQLVAEIDRRVRRRRAELGVPSLTLPTFGHVSQPPEPPVSGAYNANLYYYLKQINQAPPAAVEPLLAASPATRAPVLGRLWGLIRGQMHELILFYVNRAAADQNQLNVNLISALNELTRVSQSQQAEIDNLREQIRQLRGGEGRPAE